MNRNWSWQGWVAIALAGLALVVALGGRSSWASPSWGNQRQMPPMWSQQQAPQAQAAPPQAQNNNPDQSFGRGHRDPRGYAPGMPGMADRSDTFRGGPMMIGRHGMPNILGMLFGLAKIVGLGLLAWLLFRLFSQRRNAAQPPATPLTPAGHDPTVE